MPISDAYVVEYLLQGSCSTPSRIIWEEKSACYVTRIGDVRVELGTWHSSTGERLRLRFVCAAEEICIEEPKKKGLLGGRYSDDNERRTAELWRNLMRAVTQQCNHRKLWSFENREAIRERIYRRLLFGQAET